MQIGKTQQSYTGPDQFLPIPAKQLANQKNSHQIFKKYRKEERVLPVTRIGRQGNFFSNKMELPTPYTPIWGDFSPKNGKDDSFSFEFTYSPLFYKDIDGAFFVSGNSKEICVKIGENEWRFEGNQPCVQPSMHNKFCVTFRGPERMEVVEFQISEGDTGPIGKMINSSLTSNLREIQYISSDLEERDTGKSIEKDRALIFREGVNAPFKVFKRVQDNEETLYYDQSEKEQLAEDRYCPVFTKKIGSNDLEHVVHCVLPKGIKEGQKVPTIFYVHGGPLQHYDGDFSSSDHIWAQYFASRGFAFVGVNYRGNTGFGAEYRNAIFGDFAGQHLQDVKGLGEHVRKFEFVDSDQLHYFGHSFGAYTGGVLATKEPEFMNETFKTVTLASGVYDWSRNLRGKCEKLPEDTCLEQSCTWHGALDEAARNSRKVQWHPFFGKQIGTDNEGNPIFSDPADDSEMNKSISPMAHEVSKLTCPILLIHGTNDPVATHKFSEDFAKKLSDANCKVETRFVEGANHDFKGVKPFKQMLGSAKRFIQGHSETKESKELNEQFSQISLI